MTSNGLIVFIKNPEVGKAKTRVAATVGDDKAMEVYLSLLRITSDVVVSVDATRHLFYSHFINEADDWDNGLYVKDIQIDGDLGAKMLDAFTKALGHSEKVIIIGSDCPYITVDIINQAYADLDSTDVVIGPADDGGYYLLGMKTTVPEIFQNMRWSEADVRSVTESRLNELSISYSLLPMLSDIDYWEDWQQYLSTKS